MFVKRAGNVDKDAVISSSVGRCPGCGKPIVGMCKTGKCGTGPTFCPECSSSKKPESESVNDNS